jgi:hypothetical protein
MASCVANSAEEGVSPDCPEVDRRLRGALDCREVR